MRKIDLIYRNLLKLLLDLTAEGAQFLGYHDGLGEEPQEELVELAEKISAERLEILDTFENVEIHSDFSDLIEYLEQFAVSYSDYPNLRGDETFAIIRIIEKLCDEYSGSVINLEEEIDENEFVLVPVTQSTSQNNFIYFDGTDVDNSLMLINLRNRMKFEAFVDDTAVGIPLFFYLLHKIGGGAMLGAHKYILVRTNLEAESKKVWSTLCLHMIKDGKWMHEPHEYLVKPSVTSACSVSIGETYQQFSDTIDVLSEYNYQKDILDKYLRIYHVVENFMFKSPIVSLEKQANGNVFSIRDFKRMYDSVSRSELSALKNLLGGVLSLEFTPGVSFRDKVFSDWQGLVPGWFGGVDTKIDALLAILRIVTRNGDFVEYSNVNDVSIDNVISQLVYSFRNSMVHNRETEFHLTHLTLNAHDVIDDAARIVLERFLLPLMEEISFFLVIKRNDLVWFDNPSLILWNEA